MNCQDACIIGELSYRFPFSPSVAADLCCPKKISAISRRVFDVVIHKPTKVQPRQAYLEGAAS